MTDKNIKDGAGPVGYPGEAPEHVEQAQGIVKEIGELTLNAILTEGGLARIFGRHQVSIKRAVQRGELPPPTRLLGEPIWTAGAIIRHLEERLEAAQKEAQETERRLQDLTP